MRERQSSWLGTKILADYREMICVVLEGIIDEINGGDDDGNSTQVDASWEWFRKSQEGQSLMKK